MYTQLHCEQAQKVIKKRRVVTFVPGLALLLFGIAVFSYCQLNRLDWGWIFASAMTVVAGGYVIFFNETYLKPVRVYHCYLTSMLHGIKRETEGRLQAVADEISDKDGLDAYAVTVNVGEKEEAEDERLFYFDAQMERPDIPIGTHVKVTTHDKMIVEIQKT